MLLAAIDELVRVGGASERWAIKQMGVSRATFYRWKGRAKEGQLKDRRQGLQNQCGALPEEEAAVIAYAIARPRDGYRRLCWQMVDEDVAYLSPSSVYRILARHDLLYRWKRSTTSTGKKPKEAGRPDEVWHTDLMYLWVAGRWYFLVSVLDSYSRYIVTWELAYTMAAAEVVNVVHTALEGRPGVKPRIVRDNGSQFVAKEWRQLIAKFELVDIATKVRHPESNGRIERYHRSVREEGLTDEELDNVNRAVDKIAEWVRYYNEQRLHAGLNYLRPVDYYRKDPWPLVEEQRRKLAAAAVRRAKRLRQQESK